MNIKGTAIVTGKFAIIAAFGEERWNSFFAKLAAKDKFFNNTILSITLIPLEKHLFFLDEMLKEFFNNNTNQYILFGRTAAKFALSPGGPYNSYLLTKDIKRFAENVMPKIWTTYYDEGRLTAHLEGNTVHIQITELPIKHIYFENLIMGYFKQALKMLGKQSNEKRIKSLAKGDDYIDYQYELKDS
jgi:hypothetical protein